MAVIEFYQNHKTKTDESQSPWASPEEMQKFSSGDISRDVILAQNASLADADTTTWEFTRNANVAVIGGTGSGKTRSFVLPNLINHTGNYIITDTKKELFKATSKGFKDDGYEVLCLDSIDIAESCRFDPLHYITCEEDISAIVELILDSITPNRNTGTRANEIFWEETAALLMRALVGVLLVLEEYDGALAQNAQHEKPYKYLCMKRLLELTNLISTPSDNMEGTPIDNLFNAVASGTIDGTLSFLPVNLPPLPTCYAVRQYRDFSIAAEKTLQSIVISLNAHISQLKTPECMRVFSDDDLRLDQIDQGKRVIYLVMSDNESSTSFLGRMAFRLLLNRALKKADARPDGRLEKPVTFVCDEFANLGRIADFERVISVVRSRRINFFICLQSISQLNSTYGSNQASIILDNCDSLVYLGAGSSYESAQYVSQLCGTYVAGTQLVGVERKRMDISAQVATPSDILRLPRKDCIVKISGAKPFYTQKYDVFDHPNVHKFLCLHSN